MSKNLDPASGKPNVTTFLLLGYDHNGERCIIGNLRSLRYTTPDGEVRKAGNAGCASLMGEHLQAGESFSDAALRGAQEEWLANNDSISLDDFSELGGRETAKTFNTLVLCKRLFTPNDLEIKEGFGAMFLPIGDLVYAAEDDFLTEASFGVLKVVGDSPKAIQERLHQRFNELQSL